MKPEFMRLRRALALAIATVMASIGLAVLAPAGAALAHHNTVGVKASCENYVWTITWTITNSERDKKESIVASNQPDLVPVGTEIAAGATLKVTETVAGPISKTLTVKGYWPKTNHTDAARSASINPKDFVGTCAKPTPTPTPTPPVAQPDVEASLEASTCVYQDGAARGTVTARVTGLSSHYDYTVTLLSGTTTIATASVTKSASTAAFTNQAPGSYSVTVAKKGKVIATSPIVTLADCTPVPPKPTPTPSPTPPPTVPPVVLDDERPTIAASPVDCVSGVPRSITVTVDILYDDENYTVAILAADGTDVAVKPVSGVTSQTLVFADLPSPATYTAELRSASPARTVASDSETISLVPCLVASSVTLPSITLPAAATAPTQTQAQALAATGASGFIPLGVMAALLLTAGGIVITLRMRRMAQAVETLDA